MPGRLARIIARGAPTTMGTLVGVLVTLTSPLRQSPGWFLWALFAVALTSAAGIIFTIGLARLREIPVRPPLAEGVVLCGVPFLLVVGFTVWSPEQNWRGLGLVVCAMAGAVPAILAMLAIRRAANTLDQTLTSGSRAATLIDLRRLVLRLLPPLGILVALATLSLGLARKYTPTTANLFPEESVVVFGLAGSLFVVGFYLPTTAILRRQAETLCAQVFDLASADDGEAILGRAEQRQRLEELLGATRKPWEELQAGLIALSPLVSSTTTLLLPS